MSDEPTDRDDPAPSVDRAVLLIAHGSRRPEANADLERAALRLRARLGSGTPVETAYLELARPTIPEGAAACLAHRPRTVVLLPFFLSAGEHVVRDLQRFREEFAAASPHVTFVVAPPLGLHPGLIDALADRLDEAGPAPR